MKQVLHIFRKDTRHFWPEIVASIAITLAFVLVTPSTWKIIDDQLLQSRITIISTTLNILLPISWWLLIARVTHAESLVGENQFWLTRPYEWKRLLAAKVLFLAAWVAIPFFLAQMLIVAQAGFSPASYIPGLLLSAGLGLTILGVPLFALAAVTPNFARMTITLLAIVLALAAFSFGASTINFGVASAAVPYQDDQLILGVLLIGSVVAIVLQYASRKVWVSQAVLAAIPLVIGLIAYSFARQSLVDRGYPVSAKPHMQMSFAPDADHVVKASTPIRTQEVWVEVPLRFSGVEDGYAAVTRNIRFSMTAADGSQWTSPWNMMEARSLPGSQAVPVNIRMPRAVFDRFKSAPVILHLAFAINRMQADANSTMPLPDGEFMAPGVGFCTAQFEWTGMHWPGLSCRSALHQPRLTHATLEWTNGPCSGSQPPAENVRQGDAWLGSADVGNTDFEFSGVSNFQVNFMTMGPGDFGNIRSHRLHFCPGTPLTITQYHLVDRSQAELTIPGFQLPANVSR
jgi:hypothetical protein